MQRWMQSAAGGTSHRLNPGLAMIRSRSSSPVPETGKSRATSTVVMVLPPSAGASFALFHSLILRFLLLCVFELFDGAARDRIKSRAARFQMRLDRRAHARIPEFLDVIGRPGHG